jgi:hypothetical protein
MGVRQINVNIEVGTGIIKVFERIDIENHQIFSEFIDNSFQSFRDNIEVLVDELHVRKCEVRIDWTNDEIIITDNAFGMDEESFERALRLNAPAKSYAKDSLSRYGIGLKYAASNLGSVYTIESTQYGSPLKFTGTVDVDEWIAKNPKTMPIEVIDDFDVNKHFTVITIKRLKHKFNEAEMKRIINRLGTIYYYFIDTKKQLEIYVNDVKVEYTEPVLFRDKNGSEVMETFNKTFYFEGKPYEFSGWIGVLNKGSTYDAGLSLIQNHRVIELNFRPKEIFGPGNDYRYQRLVGNVEFLGDNWEVRVNKDGLAWKGTELKERFIEELNKLPGVRRVQAEAKERRTRENPTRKVRITTEKCNVDGLKQVYEIGEKVCFTVTPNEGCSIKSAKVNSQELSPSSVEGNTFSFTVDADMPSIILIKVICESEKSGGSVKVTPTGSVVVDTPPTYGPKVIVKPLSKKQRIEKTFSGMKSTKVPGENIKEEPNLYQDGIIVEYQNTKYSFEIEEVYESATKEWMDLKEMKYPLENSYKILINFNSGFFKYITMNEETKMLLNNMCISIALSMITSAASGLPMDKSKILIDKLNDVIFKSGK